MHVKFNESFWYVFLFMNLKSKKPPYYKSGGLFSKQIRTPAYYIAFKPVEVHFYN